MRDPLISIVILNCNGLKYIQKTVPQALSLNYSNYEVLVVDNGSKDGSVEYLKKIERVNLIENENNLGYSKGKKKGIEVARGEYILLLDEDILIRDENILQGMLSEYLNLKNVGFMSILLEQHGKHKTTLYGGFIRFFGFYNNESVELNKIIGKNTFECVSPDGGAIFFKKEVFLGLGMYDESQPYYIDVGDLGIRARVMGFKNYTYCKKCFVNLGDDRKSGDIERWCWKYKYNFSGIARVMWKNFSSGSLLAHFPFFVIFSLAKTIKHFVSKKSFCVIESFVFSVLLFFRNFSDTLKERRNIQSRRVSVGDHFLKIKHPNFDE